jgi:hypothetical protein
VGWETELEGCKAGSTVSDAGEWGCITAQVALSDVLQSIYMGPNLINKSSKKRQGRESMKKMQCDNLSQSTVHINGNLAGTIMSPVWKQPGAAATADTRSQLGLDNSCWPFTRCTYWGIHVSRGKVLFYLTSSLKPVAGVRDYWFLLFGNPAGVSFLLIQAQTWARHTNTICLRTHQPEQWWGVWCESSLRDKLSKPNFEVK